MQCVGYWKENLKSYLITYDQLDAFTKYRCWVYQRLAMQEFDLDIHVVSPNTQGLTWTRCWCRCQSDLSVTSIKMLTARIGNKVLLFHLNWMRMKESVSCFKGWLRWFCINIFCTVDRCPMYFNDGEDPWTVEENYIKVFDFTNQNSVSQPALSSLAVIFFVVSLITRTNEN